ncbi:MAG: hypothetical protein RJB62_381 [Pseudomonadota bacterium]|jgi:protein required for attachment to host cells
MTSIAHDTWIAVADGAKALILRNDGEADMPNFVVVEVFERPSQETTADLGADRPGRIQESSSARRSSVDQTDWHDIEEGRFAERFAETLGKRCEAGEFSKIVIVAPPRALADLRAHFSKRLQDAIISEIDKDLTNHPLDKIEKIITAA